MIPGSARRALLLCLTATVCASAQQAPLAVPGSLAPLQTSTPEALRSHIASLRELVRACQASPLACDASKTGDDDSLNRNGHAVIIRWEWLRITLESARDGALPNRTHLLDQSLARLDEEEQSDIDSAPVAATAFDAARNHADTILSRPEFRTVSSLSESDRLQARLARWFSSLFTGASELGRRAPWLGFVLEWGFIGLTIVAVLVWVQKTMQRQRLAISLGAPSISGTWQKESTDWAQLAREQAERRDWREAVHCLYWASIVILEGRRLWRRNLARTPREYVVLLEPGSPQQTTLRSLTRIFEHIWYGLRPADEDDYTRALSLFEQLRSAERA